MKQKPIVAIQGVKASFHHVAAKNFFPDLSEIVECSTFPKLFEALENNRCDYALMAIENALAGSILPNYNLMEKYQVKILGEVYLKIEMCLLALPGQKISDIKFITSHPMAIHQCQDFILSLKNVTVVEHADTAESAKDIKEKNLTHFASIASELAAQTYGLELLQKNIESDRANFTRFLVLCRSNDYEKIEGANKASLKFVTRHEPGSLAKVLTSFHEHSVNLSKIQSLPLIGRPYDYGFHVDLEWKDDHDLQIALAELKFKTKEIIYFGEYKKAKRVEL